MNYYHLPSGLPDLTGVLGSSRVFFFKIRPWLDYDWLSQTSHVSSFGCWNMGMDQYLLIPFLEGWTSIYQLFWCSPGVQGFDTLPHLLVGGLEHDFFLLSISWECHHPNWLSLHHFSEGLKPPTSLFRNLQHSILLLKIISFWNLDLGEFDSSCDL